MVNVALLVLLVAQDAPAPGAEPQGVSVSVSPQFCEWAYDHRVLGKPWTHKAYPEWVLDCGAATYRVCVLERGSKVKRANYEKKQDRSLACEAQCKDGEPEQLRDWRKPDTD